MFQKYTFLTLLDAKTKALIFFKCFFKIHFASFFIFSYYVTVIRIFAQMQNCVFVYIDKNIDGFCICFDKLLTAFCCYDIILQTAVDAKICKL